MSVIHLKKKDVVKSSVKGVGIEFDHEKLATILGVSGKNEICEYIKDVWEESKNTKPLEITRRVANNDTLTAARRVKSGEKFYDVEDKDRGSPEVQKRFKRRLHKVRLGRRNKVLRSRPSCPIGRIPEAVMTKLQAEFERKRANRFLADLEKAKAENARLLALLHQAQSKPHP
ncbi:hypothetical protein Dimus_008367 [Dionaea muscipula]